MPLLTLGMSITAVFITSLIGMRCDQDFSPQDPGSLLATDTEPRDPSVVISGFSGSSSAVPVPSASVPTFKDQTQTVLHGPHALPRACLARQEVDELPMVEAQKCPNP